MNFFLLPLSSNNSVNFFATAIILVSKESQFHALSFAYIFKCGSLLENELSYLLE